MRTHFRAFEDSQSLFSSRYQKVLKGRIYNITHFATKVRVFTTVGLIFNPSHFAAVYPTASLVHLTLSSPKLYHAWGK